MQIAFVIYNGLTLLDLAGVYDPVTRLRSMGFVPDLACDLCARTPEVRSSEGARLVPDRVACDLAEYDYVIVPGGDGVRELMGDPGFLRWIPAPSAKTAVAAVCGGSLLLGASGMLRSCRATTHPDLRGPLAHFAREVSSDRVVDEGRIITAGGVTASIDLGLYLCERIAGPEAREKIRRQMDYSCYRSR